MSLSATPTTRPYKVSADANNETAISVAAASRVRVKCGIFIEVFAMADLSTFEQYYKLADQLIEKVSKEDLAECARLLALNVAHYQSKYGELPLEETLAMIGMTKPNEAQIQLMANGMEVLVGVLGSVCSGLDQPRH